VDQSSENPGISQPQLFTRQSRPSYSPYLKSKRSSGILLRLCCFFFAPTTFVPCPSPCCPFLAVKLKRFLNAIGPQMFLHRGDTPFRLGLAYCFFLLSLGRECSKMERVSESL